MADDNPIANNHYGDDLDQRIRRQFPPLSPRQLDIVRYLVNGLSEKQIALAMGITQHTVHVHMKHLYLRCGVSSRGELLGRIIRGMLAEIRTT